MAAVPALVRALRYGDVRGTDTGALSAVVDALIVRVCAGLPAAVGGLADDAAAALRDGWTRCTRRSDCTPRASSAGRPATAGWRR